nr:uncharacterized protein LOC129057544 [Pongo abelii]
MFNAAFLASEQDLARWVCSGIARQRGRGCRLEHRPSFRALGCISSPGLQRNTFEGHWGPKGDLGECGLQGEPSSVVHLEAERMALAFRVEVKYTCIIWHDYCVIVEVVVVPRKASTSSPSIGAFGRFRALRALARGALGSPGGSPPPLRGPRLLLLLRAPPRGPRREWGSGAPAGPRSGRRLGPPSSGAPREGPGLARGGESRLAPPLRRPPQSCRLPRGRPVL